MKALLLNDGCYGGLDKVAFPVEVECTLGAHVNVSYHELVRIGADHTAFDRHLTYPWALGIEAVIIEEVTHDG